MPTFVAGCQALTAGSNVAHRAITVAAAIARKK
jgi:hypothetical protein